MKHLNLIDKAFLLKKTSLFGSLDLDLLLTIADKMEMVAFKQGETIFQVDQEAHLMFLIVEGRVLLTSPDGKERLAQLSASEFFGDEGIFNQRPRSYNATAEDRTGLLALSRPHLLAIINECPNVAVSLLEAYTASITFRKR